MYECVRQVKRVVSVSQLRAVVAALRDASNLIVFASCCQCSECVQLCFGSLCIASRRSGTCINLIGVV